LQVSFRSRICFIIFALAHFQYAGNLGDWADVEALEEFRRHMSKQRGLGSLADLAKILEEASNPESQVREDRKESKPKPTLARKAGGIKQMRTLDPKRKLWYEKRLKEQSEDAKALETVKPEVPETRHTPALTKAAAGRAGGGLLESLATVNKDAKAKSEGGKDRAEAWRRKPGDKLF
jgi:hypothetical protein